MPSNIHKRHSHHDTNYHTLTVNDTMNTHLAPMRSNIGVIASAVVDGVMQVDLDIDETLLAKELKQDWGNSNLASIVTNSANLTVALDSQKTTIENMDSNLVYCDTNAIVVSSTALPTGASTELRQDWGNSNLASIVTNTADNATETTLSALNGKVTACDTGAVVVSSGTVTATQSGIWNVTNVSGTVSLPTGASTAALQTSGNALLTSATALLTDIETNTDSLAVVGGGGESTALRVTLANDSTGVVSVDDNGGSLTIDGTVSAIQSGAWNVTNDIWYCFPSNWCSHRSHFIIIKWQGNSLQYRRCGSF
jgi:hypothetical protein